VRGKLVYEDPSRFTQVLLELQDDPDVEILHIKNRMALDFDARVIGSYRDIIVHVALKGSPHVCEIQLNLHLMHSIKNKLGPEAHVRYLKFRDTKFDGL
jgi:hypothetical protein